MMRSLLVVGLSVLALAGCSSSSSGVADNTACVGARGAYALTDTSTAETGALCPAGGKLGANPATDVQVDLVASGVTWTESLGGGTLSGTFAMSGCVAEIEFVGLGKMPSGEGVKITLKRHLTFGENSISGTWDSLLEGESGNSCAVKGTSGASKK